MPAGVDLDWCVQYCERGDLVRMRGCKLEPHRRSDIVHHRMEPIQVDGFDRGGCEPAKAGPGVVESRGPLRKSQPRQVEGDSAETSFGQFDNELAIEERRRRHAVQAHHWQTVAQVEHERLDTPDGESIARSFVGIDHGIDSAGRWPVTPHPGSSADVRALHQRGLVRADAVGVVIRRRVRRGCRRRRSIRPRRGRGRRGRARR